jgi:hypothetical protein
MVFIEIKNDEIFKSNGGENERFDRIFIGFD